MSLANKQYSILEKRKLLFQKQTFLCIVYINKYCCVEKQLKNLEWIHTCSTLNSSRPI